MLLYKLNISKLQSSYDCVAINIKNADHSLPTIDT